MNSETKLMLWHLAALICCMSFVTSANAADFGDFPAEAYRGDVVEQIDLDSHPDAKTFRTRLQAALYGEERFGGHFAITYWGCGSSCQVLAIVDLRNGAVHFGPTASLGYDYRDDSDLLVVNPLENIGELNPDAPFCVDGGSPWATTSHYYVWNGNDFLLHQELNYCQN
jgi:hypothetical protein